MRSTRSSSTTRRNGFDSLTRGEVTGYDDEFAGLVEAYAAESDNTSC